MLKFAWRNLTHQRLRLVISVGGVALAMLLILVMNGFFAGSEEHAVIYIRNQPASIWVMQAGVENIHMASSILPADAVERVRETAGVAEAVGVLYTSGVVQMGDALVPNYIFGIDPNMPFGGPWSLAEGSANLALNEIVIDNTLARRYGLGLGDTVSILGYPLTIAGLSEGTAGIARHQYGFCQQSSTGSGDGCRAPGCQLCPGSTRSRR
jgi:putative ABC transport system permease protein